MSWILDMFCPISTMAPTQEISPITCPMSKKDFICSECNKVAQNVFSTVNHQNTGKIHKLCSDDCMKKFFSHKDEWPNIHFGD